MSGEIPGMATSDDQQRRFDQRAVERAIELGMVESGNGPALSDAISARRDGGSRETAAELLGELAGLDRHQTVQLAERLSGGQIFESPTMIELPSNIDIKLPRREGGISDSSHGVPLTPAPGSVSASGHDSIMDIGDLLESEQDIPTLKVPTDAESDLATPPADGTRISSRRRSAIPDDALDASAESSGEIRVRDVLAAESVPIDARRVQVGNPGVGTTGGLTNTGDVTGTGRTTAPGEDTAAAGDIAIQCAHCNHHFTADLPPDAESGTIATALLHCPACGHAQPLREIDEAGDDDDSAEMALIAALSTSTPAESSHDPWVGRVIGRCRVKRKIGQGGMGSVYLAIHEVLERDRALKLLPKKFTKDKKAADRFIQEARLTARLEHNNIVQVYDVGQEGENFFIVMQYADGGSLSRLLRKRGRLRYSYALRMAEQIASGLECAHQNGIVHRDVKPDNIMLMTDGTAKIADFGLAKNTGFGADITQAGLIMGSPAYMSPEQCDGTDVDHRSDIYSLGITLFQMMCGRRPFQGATPLAMMLMHQSEEPPRPSEVQPEIPAWVDPVVIRMLAKDKHDRYQNAGEVLTAIRDLLHRHDLEKPMRVSARRPQAETLFGLVALQDHLLVPEQVAGLITLWNEAREQYGDPPGFGQIARQKGWLSADIDERIRLRVNQLVDMGIDPPAEMLDRMVADEKAGQAIPLPLPLPDEKISATNMHSVGTPPALTGQTTAGAATTGAASSELAVVRELVEAEDKTPVTLDEDDLEAAKIEFIQLQSDLREIYRGDDNPRRALEVFRPFAEQYAATNFGAAIRTYHRKLIGKVAAACDRVGVKLMQRNKLDEAIRWFDESLELADDNALVWNNRGIARMRLGALGAAMRDFQQALDREPLAMIHYNQGQVLRKMDKLDEAEAAYTKCLDMDPSHDKAWCNLGGVRFTRKDFAGALQDFEKALELNDKNAEALTGRGKIFRRQGDHERARAEFQRLVEIAPKSGKAWCSLADVLLEEGNLDEAKKNYQKAVRLDSGQPDPLYGLAVIAARQNDADKALALLKKALKKGFRRFRRVKKESGFAILADRPEFKALLAGMRHR